MSSDKQDLIFRHTGRIREERAAKLEPPIPPYDPRDYSDTPSVSYDARDVLRDFPPPGGYPPPPPPPRRTGPGVSKGLADAAIEERYESRDRYDRYRTGISPSRRVSSPGPIEDDFERVRYRRDRARERSVSPYNMVTE